MLRKFLSRIANGVFVGYRQLRSFLSRTVIQLRYPGVEFSHGCTVGCHVEIKAIDGGEITIGSNVHFADNATVVCRYGSLTIGNNSYVGKGSVIVARERITVGRGALIAEYVTIRDQHHGMERAELAFYEQPFTTSPISIGENVWLGAKSTVLKGVAIGSDVVVGANSVVTKDVADKSTVVGVPARLTGPTA